MSGRQRKHRKHLATLDSARRYFARWRGFEYGSPTARWLHMVQYLAWCRQQAEWHRKHDTALDAHLPF